MTATPVEVGSVRGEYGVDAPYVPVGLGAAGIFFVALGAFYIVKGNSTWAFGDVASGLIFVLSTASYLYATRRGKLVVWSRLLADLDLTGSEHVLDMGCGRGAVLLIAAKYVSDGTAVGLDLWSRSDQSGNRPEVTRRNAQLEGVAARVQIETGDMTSMPFADASFDVVLSSLAIHNIKSAERRRLAVDEAARVLKPGGRMLLVDIQRTRDYANRLRTLGLSGVSERSLGWRFWYGGPWMASRLVAAQKPATLP